MSRRGIGERQYSRVIPEAQEGGALSLRADMSPGTVWDEPLDSGRFMGADSYGTRLAPGLGADLIWRSR